MKKLIEIKHDCLVQCDNSNCDYKYPYSEEAEKYMIGFVNKPCPKCGENLLTPKDYMDYQYLMKIVRFMNRWFSWITYFYSKESWKKSNSVTVHCHEGIKINENK